MPNVVPVEQRLKFFVFVIESPSAVDLYHRRGEGDVLERAIGLNGIQCVSKLAISRVAFAASIKIGLSEAMTAMPGLIPVLHISAHGSSEGIQLSSGEVILWDELRDLLVPVNRALNGFLVVCMSTCDGYSGIRMAMVSEEGAEHPFFAIVGNAGKPTWPETAVAFATFYHLLANGYHVNDAVAAMRVASGNNKFILSTAEESRQGYLEFIRGLDAIEVRQELEQQANDEPGALAKMLKS